MMPPVFSRPGGKEEGVFSSKGKGKRRIEILSTPDIWAERWVGGIFLVVYGSRENWRLSLLVGERRVGLGGCRGPAWTGYVFCCSGCPREVGIGLADPGLHWVGSGVCTVGWPSPPIPSLLWKNRTRSQLHTCIFTLSYGHLNWDHSIITKLHQPASGFH